MSEMRQDPVSGFWVIIAPERGLRPSDFDRRRHGPPHDAGACPFCADRPDGLVAEYPGGGKPWAVRVLANKYPALQPDGPVKRAQIGPYESLPGVGAHEVFIDTPEHGLDVCNLPATQAAMVLRAYRERMRYYAKDRRMAYAQVFRNFGADAGASLSHPHSQMIVTPVIPSNVKVEIYGSQRHYESFGSCPYCDKLNFELVEGSRLCLQSSGFVALAPYASRLPYEMLILPRHHNHDFTQTTDEDLEDLGGMLSQAVSRLHHVIPGAPYNYFLHTAPFRDGVSAHFHWHIELLPRLTVPGGFEWGSGFHINPVTPEAAAEALRPA